MLCSWFACALYPCFSFGTGGNILTHCGQWVNRLRSHWAVHVCQYMWVCITVVCLAGLCGDSFPVFSSTKRSFCGLSNLFSSQWITFYQVEEFWNTKWSVVSGLFHLSTFKHWDPFPMILRDNNEADLYQNSQKITLVLYSLLMIMFYMVWYCIVYDEVSYRICTVSTMELHHKVVSSLM